MDQKEVMQIIADSIVDSAKKDWLNAHFEVLVLGDSVDTELRFEYSDNSTGYEFIANHGNISKAVIDYHKSLAETGNSKWNKMLFNLHSNGKFDINLQWDQELQDEYEEDSRI